MKKHLSILALWVRSTFWGAAGILIVTFAAEAGLLWRQIDGVRAGTVPDFSAMVSGSQMQWPYFAGLTLLWVWLLVAGCRARRNTLGRLSVAEEKIALWHGACCAGWLAVFWAVQVGAVLVGYRMFLGAADPLTISGQTLFLACYRDDLLHWLIPLQDLWTAVWGTAAVLVLSLTTAVDGYCWRRGKRFSSLKSSLPWAILALGPVFGEGTMPWALAVMLVVVAGIDINRLYRGWKEGD